MIMIMIMIFQLVGFLDNHIFRIFHYASVCLCSLL